MGAGLRLQNHAPRMRADSFRCVRGLIGTCTDTPVARPSMLSLSHYVRSAVTKGSQTMLVAQAAALLGSQGTLIKKLYEGSKNDNDPVARCATAAQADKECGSCFQVTEGQTARGDPAPLFCACGRAGFGCATYNTNREYNVYAFITGPPHALELPLA